MQCIQCCIQSDILLPSKIRDSSPVSVCPPSYDKPSRALPSSLDNAFYLFSGTATSMGLLFSILISVISVLPPWKVYQGLFIKLYTIGMLIQPRTKAMHATKTTLSICVSKDGEEIATMIPGREEADERKMREGSGKTLRWEQSLARQGHHHHHHMARLHQDLHMYTTRTQQYRV